MAAQKGSTHQPGRYGLGHKTQARALIMFTAALTPESGRVVAALGLIINSSEPPARPGLPSQHLGELAYRCLLSSLGLRPPS